jgi:hypothetical protein
MRRQQRVGLILLVASIPTSGPAAAESPLSVAASETYGIAAQTVAIIPSTAFQPRSSTTGYHTATGLERYLTNAGSLQAGVIFPNGSQIERIELRACDESATDQVTLSMGACPTPGGACPLAGSMATGTAAMPGCGYFGLDLATPLIVNNETAPISISVVTGSTANATFSAVKLYYRLRVSPSPAVATFPNDVPTGHQFFQFIEALAAAGITGGCGPGAYCPDQPVTRGQMAVFLAAALGLHFPN